MAKKDFNTIKLGGDTDSQALDMSLTAHKDGEPSKKRGAYKTTTPKRANYCIRLQPSIKKKLDIFLTNNDLKISDYLEKIILENIK